MSRADPSVSRLIHRLGGARRTRGIAALLLVGSLGAAPPPPASAAEELLVLPPMMVESSEGGFSWRYLALPGFEMLTTCQDYTAIPFARRSARLEQLLYTLIPRQFLFQSSVPELHLLVDDSAGRLLPKQMLVDMVRGKGGAVGPHGTVVAPVDLAFAMTSETTIDKTRRKVRTYIRTPYFLPNLRLTDTDSVAVFSLVRENSRRPTFGYTPDRIAFLLTRRAPTLPEWVIEGCLDLFQQSNFDAESVEVKPMRWLSAEEKEAILRPQKKGPPPEPYPLLTMAELFAGSRPAPGVEQSSAVRLWRAQCGLFLRWAIAENRPERREALVRFVKRCEQELPDEAAFRDCFGLGYGEMETVLRTYLRSALTDTRVLTAPPPTAPADMELRPATPGEIARMRGEWERLEIDYVRQRYPELAERYREQARRTLDRAYQAGDRDPRLLASLGLAELDGGIPATAAALLEQSVQAGARRPRVLFELARLRYEALPADGELSAADAESVLILLREATRIDPPLREVYALMFLVWSRRAGLPDEAELLRLNDGARLFPDSSGGVLRAAYFNFVRGHWAVAQEFIVLGRRHSRDPAILIHFDRLAAEVATAGAAASGGPEP